MVFRFRECFALRLLVNNVLVIEILTHRALYNRRNFLHYIIPPILGAFYNKEKNILFIDIEQTISQ